MDKRTPYVYLDYSAVNVFAFGRIHRQTCSDLLTQSQLWRETSAQLIQHKLTRAHPQPLGTGGSLLLHTTFPVLLDCVAKQALYVNFQAFCEDN